MSAPSACSVARANKLALRFTFWVKRRHERLRVYLQTGQRKLATHNRKCGRRQTRALMARADPAPLAGLVFTSVLCSCQNRRSSRSKSRPERSRLPGGASLSLFCQ